MASLNVQAQIRHNAETVQDYFRDLQKWRSAIKENEAPGGRAGKRVESSTRTSPLGAHSSDCSTVPSGSPQEDQREGQPRNTCTVVRGDATVLSARKNKHDLARDRNSIASYYAAWDRFNVDEELAKLDNEDPNRHTTIRQNEFKTAPPSEVKMSAKTSRYATRRRGKGTMRAVVKARETKDAEAVDTVATDSSTSPILRNHAGVEDVGGVLRSLRTQLSKALARNQEGLFDYSFSRCRSAIKGFEACISCLEDHSLSRALSITRSVQACPLLLSQWRKLRSIFHTNLGFSQLCLARSNRVTECAASAQLDWPESPFVHLLRAACHKNEGNYLQAARHLRDLLARLSSEESPKPTHEGSERDLKDRQSVTTGDLLAASIAALSMGDFNFLSTTIAITCDKTETAAAAFVRANIHNEFYRGQVQETFSCATLSQELPVSEVQRAAETTGLRRNQDSGGTPCSRSAAVATPRKHCTDKKATEGPDSGVMGKQDQAGKGQHIRPASIQSPCFVLKSAVSAELSETLALRQKEVLALRRQRQQQVWQLNQKRLRELESGIQVNGRFPQVTPMSGKEGNSFASSTTSKTKEDFFGCPTGSGSGGVDSTAGEAARHNDTTASTLGTNTARQLHVHALGDSFYSKKREVQYQVAVRRLPESEKQAGCAAHRRELTHGEERPAMFELYAENQAREHTKKWYVTSTEGNDEQLCPKNTLSSSTEAEGEAVDYNRSVRDQPSDSFEGHPSCVAISSATAIAPVPQATAAMDVFDGAFTAADFHRTHTISVPRLFPPSTYLSFRQAWYAACYHDVETECRETLGTVACSTNKGGCTVTQQHDSRTPAKKRLLQCVPCLRNKLTLLGSMAQDQLFPRVFTVSMEPDVLADILEVIAGGLRHTVPSNNDKESTRYGSSQTTSRVSTVPAGGQSSRSKSPSTCKASERRSTPLLPAAHMPEAKGWPSLACVHNILVQLSEVPRFWSAVYQFDKEELRILHHVLHCCLQGENSERAFQDAQRSSLAGLCTLQQHTGPPLGSENHQLQCSLAGRLRDIQARLLEVRLNAADVTGGGRGVTTELVYLCDIACLRAEALIMRGRSTPLSKWETLKLKRSMKCVQPLQKERVASEPGHRL